MGSSAHQSPAVGRLQQLLERLERLGEAVAALGGALNDPERREAERALRAAIADREAKAVPLNLGRLPGPSTAPAERAATRAGPVLAGRPTQAPPHQGYQDGRHGHGHAGARARPDDGSD